MLGRLRLFFVRSEERHPVANERAIFVVVVVVVCPARCPDGVGDVLARSLVLSLPGGTLAGLDGQLQRATSIEYRVHSSRVCVCVCAVGLRPRARLKKKGSPIDLGFVRRLSGETFSSRYTTTR